MRYLNAKDFEWHRKVNGLKVKPTCPDSILATAYTAVKSEVKTRPTLAVTSRGMVETARQPSSSLNVAYGVVIECYHNSAPMQVMFYHNLQQRVRHAEDHRISL